MELAVFIQCYVFHAFSPPLLSFFEGGYVLGNTSLLSYILRPHSHLLKYVLMLKIVQCTVKIVGL